MVRSSGETPLFLNLTDKIEESGMRTTLITGANRGIGLATAKRVAAHGDLVIGIARNEPDDGFPGEFVVCDLEDRSQTEKALETICARHEIDNLVNNAGWSFGQSVDDVDINTFMRSIELNLRAAVQCGLAVIPNMKKSGRGRIVNTASRAALGRENRTSYSAAKSALYGVTRTWALELASSGVTVNTVSPGPIESELQRQNNPQSAEYQEQFGAQMPMKRFGTPQEVAAAIDFFLSDDASFITGQILYVCGGMSVGHAPI
jgi:NAD(P)-dependent dehydrogenase (short-subunit alcohol dehydrogenase family)